MKKISMLTLCFILFSAGYATAQTQEISLIPDNTNPAIGNNLSVTVQYDCTDNTLPVLGIRIHFDSAKLTHTTFQNFFETGKVADPQVQDDTEDRDGDVSTDKLILLCYQDVNGNWPGQSLPLDLVELLFIAKTEGSTTIHVTKVSGTVGFTFQATDAEMTIRQTYTISGHVRNSDSVGISEVKVNFSNAGGSAVTDSSGYYSHDISYNWSGTVTPSKDGYTFNPTSHSYSNISSDQQDRDYTGTKTHPPVAVSSRLETDINTSAEGTLSASDADGDPLTFSIVTNGTKGTASIYNIGTGKYTYIPETGQAGQDTFTFSVSDGTADSNIAFVTVTIRAIPPSLISHEDTPELRPTLEWNAAPGATDYRIQIDDQTSFASPIIEAYTGGTLTYTPPVNLPLGDICWRVSGNPDESLFSEYGHFVIKKLPPLHLSVIPGSHDFGTLPIQIAGRKSEIRSVSKGSVRLTPLEQLSAEYVKSQVIVKTKPGKRAFREKVVIQEDLKVTEVTELSLVGAELWQMDETVENALNRYWENPSLEYIEPNYKVYPIELPEDPDFSELWGLHNTGQTGGTPDADIDIPEAWELHAGGEVIVAVIDSGVDYTHPDLAPNMWRNPGEIPDNRIDDDENGFVDDVYGYDFANDDADPFDDLSHGTHCAGTIAAAGNNGIGVIGVNPSAKIMALKFLNSYGSGDTADAIRALEYAVRMGVRITNNSWGGGTYSSAMYEAIQAAENAGQLFVAATGNSSRDIDVNPHYPSSYPLDNIISVASTDHEDKLSHFSNYGATSADLAAPGSDIYSTVPVKQGNYDKKDGTSMATPHVSGVASLIWSAYPALTVSGVKDAILSGVDPLDSLRGRVFTGGRLNAYNALTGIVNPGEKTFTLSDTGDAELGIGTLSVTGPDQSDFSLDADNCSGQTLAPDQGCTVTVAFSPTSGGSREAYLTIPSDDPDAPLFDVGLTGRGIPVWESVIHARGEEGVAEEGVQTTTYHPESGQADENVLVSGYDAIIGGNIRTEKLPAPPDPPKYSVMMVLWYADWSGPYLRDIRKQGEKLSIWVIEVDPNGNLTPPVSRTSVITWNPDTFSSAGEYQLRQGFDGKGEIVIEDMREIAELSVTGQDKRYFTIEFISDNGDTLKDAILALKLAAGMETGEVYSGSDVDGDGKIGLKEAVYALRVAIGE